MHKQVSVQFTQTVNFCPNSPESPFLEFQTREPPQWKTSDLRWSKFTPKYPPPHEKLQIWDDQSLLRNTPQWKTSDLRSPKFTPKSPPMKNFRFEMTKVYSEIPPKWKTSDLRWPKFTPKYPPMKNFRFEMAKVYSKIPPPPNEKLQIWDGQSLLQNNPPPPPPPNEKLQIWDGQSLLRNTPHPQ